LKSLFDNEFEMKDMVLVEILNIEITRDLSLEEVFFFLFVSERYIQMVLILFGTKGVKSISTSLKTSIHLSRPNYTPID